MKYDYLIVGSGLSGAIFAQKMTEHGKKCLVIDKRNHIGGNIYSEKKDGIEVHMYGAHIFHTSIERVWEYVNKFTKFNNYFHSPLALYHGEVYSMPFNMYTFAKMWGVTKPSEASAIIEEQRKKENIVDPKNLEEQALYLVGRDIYEKLVKEYTEKQWGTDCTNLSPDIIKRLPIRFTYNNNYFNDKYQGIPANGYTEIITNMLKGVEVITGCTYKEFVEKNGKVADKIVYTGMIDEYYDYKLGNLEYRSLKFETEKLDEDNFQGASVVNYNDKSEDFTRIIEHKHFDNKGQNGTYITKEYSEKWSKGKEPYYPINNEKNAALYAEYKKLADSDKEVIFAGRLGTYQYFDMDKVIDQSLILCDKEIATFKQ